MPGSVLTTACEKYPAADYSRQSASILQPDWDCHLDV